MQTLQRRFWSTPPYWSSPGLSAMLQAVARPLLHHPGWLFLVFVTREDSATNEVVVQNLEICDLIHPLLSALLSSPKDYASTPVLQSGWCSHCSCFLKQGESSLSQLVLSWSPLISWTSSMPPLGHANWQTSDGSRQMLAWAGGPFSPLWCCVLLVTFETLVAALFRSLTRSFRVVLSWCLTFLMSIDAPRGESFPGGRPTVLQCFFYLTKCLRLLWRKL